MRYSVLKTVNTDGEVSHAQEDLTAKWWGLFLTDAMGTSKIIVTSQVLSTMDEEICKGDQLHTKLCSRAGCFLDKPSQLG